MMEIPQQGNVHGVVAATLLTNTPIYKNQPFTFPNILMSFAIHDYVHNIQSLQIYFVAVYLCDLPLFLYYTHEYFACDNTVHCDMPSS